MDVITYLSIGFISAIIGAIPLGTVNIAVINTTIKNDINEGLKIVFPAALAELILILISIQYHKNINQYVSKNMWIQETIVLLLFTASLILIFKKKRYKQNPSIKENTKSLSKYILGFILGLFNPTVLLYWIVAIIYLTKHQIVLKLNISVLFLLFIIGAFIGKILTLYGYGKFSNFLKNNVESINRQIQTTTGFFLLIISIIQLIKILI